MPEDTLDIKLIFQLLDKLVDGVASKLDSMELSFKTVTVIVINSNFRMYTNI